MSGPKISIYLLSPNLQKIFFQQIEFEGKAQSCAQMAAKIIEKLEAFCCDVDRQIGIIELMNKRDVEGYIDTNKLAKIREMVGDDLDNFKSTLKKYTPVIPQKRSVIDLTEHVLERKKTEYEELKKLLGRIQPIADEMEGISKANENGVKESILQAFDFQDNEVQASHDNMTKRGGSTAEIATSIFEDLSGVYSFNMVDDSVEMTLEDKKKTIQDALMNVLHETGITTTEKQGVLEAISALNRVSSEEYLNTFKKITINSLLRKIDEESAAIKKRKTEFQEVFYRYKHLCQKANIEAVQYQYSEDALATLKAEIARIERILVKEQEQAYVNECVDQVMGEMGYDLIGAREVKKRSGKHYRNELYTFNEGTAVNVTYSSDGHIAMELGGLAREDRIPTEEETKVLTEDMQSFCSEFAEFERRLQEKGVVVGNRIALSPPSAEYAAIINMCDYDIPEENQVAEINVSEKKNHVAEKKYMRRDE